MPDQIKELSTDNLKKYIKDLKEFDSLQDYFNEPYQYSMFIGSLDMLNNNIGLIETFLSMFNNPEETIDSKKVFFMDNMPEIKKVLSDIGSIIENMNDNMLEEKITEDKKLTSITVNMLQTLNDFQNYLKTKILDLNRELLNDDLENRPSITEDSVKEAKGNNATTKRLIEEVKTGEKEMVNAPISFRNNNRSSQFTSVRNKSSVPIKNIAETYLIINLDTGVVIDTITPVNGQSISVNQINNALTKCGAGNFVIFVCNKCVPLQQTTTVKI